MRKFALLLPVLAVLLAGVVLGSGIADALAAPAAPETAAVAPAAGRSGAGDNAPAPEWVETLNPPDFLKPFLRSPRR
jgi:hypothetical protein